MKSEHEMNRVMELYGDMIRRICFVHLKNQHDTEDIFQTVFLKYLLYTQTFAGAEHEKAWFIRVTINACRDLLKSFYRSKTVPLDVIREEATELNGEQTEVLEAVLSLPKKYKDVVYLYYYEQYTAVEVAKILNRRENTVYTWLARAKKMLREQLGGDGIE